jgi:hypothetical protein
MPIATGIIGEAEAEAVFARLDMAAELRGAACHDRRHDAALGAAERGAGGLTIGLPVVAEDRRRFERGQDRRYPLRRIGRPRGEPGAARKAGGTTLLPRRSSGLVVLPSVPGET